MPFDEKKYLDAGFSAKEIAEHKIKKRQEYTDAGFSQEEIDSYFGKTPVNIEPHKGFFENLYDSAVGSEDDLNNVSFVDAIKSGFQSSTTGIGLRGEMPETTVGPNAPILDRAASGIAAVTSDLPLMIGGAVVAGAGALGAGPGPHVPVAAMGGAFALPQGLRQVFVDQIENGEIDSFAEFWDRTIAASTETMKGFVTGAVTGKVGQVTKPLGAVAATGAEVATMVTVGSALEGRVPEPWEFLDAAIVVVGMKGATWAAEPVAKGMRRIYAKTGKKPAEVINDIKTDPSIKQDLIAGRDIPQAYEIFIPRVETKIKVAPETVSKSSVEQAEKEILSKISVGEQTKQKVTAKEFLEDVYQKYIDRYYYLGKEVKEITGEKVANVPAAINPLKEARLNAGSSGRILHFYNKSPIKFGTYESVGKSLKDIIEPVGENIDGFRAYGVAKTAIERNKRGIETGIDVKAAETVIKAGDKKFKKAFDELNEYQDHVLQYLRDSGVLSKEEYAIIKKANKEYVPLNRVMEVEKTHKAKAVTSSGEPRNPLKRQKGSERDIIDPLESVAKNTQLMVMMADRNAIATSFIKLAEPAGRAKKSKKKVKPVRVSEEELLKHLDDVKEKLGDNFSPGDLTIFRAKHVRPGDGEIVVYKNGKPEIYEINPKVAETLRALDEESIPHLVKAISAPASWLRAGATLVPEFMEANIIRDTTSAAIYAKNFVLVKDSLVGLKHVLKQDDTYWDYMKSGGGMASLVSLDRKYLQENIQSMLQERPVVNLIKEPLTMLRMASELSELSTRVGAFKKATGGKTDKASLQEAGYISREATLDFARMGAQGRALNMMAAFTNAKLQGGDRMFRAIKDDPAGTSAKIFAYLTLPALLIHSTHFEQDDEGNWKQSDWYKYGVPQWQKDLYYIFKLPGEDGPIIRIPKPFELGVIFATGPERIMDMIVADSPNTIPELLGTVGTGLIPNLTPTAAVPIVEVVTNYSMFTGEPLVPPQREKLLPAYRDAPRTTEFTKALAKAFGEVPYLAEMDITSPPAIDSFIFNWTGGLGRYAIKMLDWSGRKAGILPDIPKAEMTFADMPFIKAFVTRFPSKSTGAITDFYDRFEQADMYLSTYNSLMKEGRVQDALNIYQNHPEMMQKSETIRKYKQSMTEIYQIIRFVEKDTEMTPAEKREWLDKMFITLHEMAIVGNQYMDEIENKIGKK